MYVKIHSMHVKKIQERQFLEIKKSNVKNQAGFGWGVLGYWGGVLGIYRGGNIGVWGGR